MTWIAFEGARRIASGDPSAVALKTKKVMELGRHVPVYIFDGVTSHVVEVDLRGTPKQVLRRLPGPAEPAPTPDPDAPRGPGRPRLGVVAREVTLLPRHWDWLNSQPGGASVALRKLVEHARKANEGIDRIRVARESAYRFMSAMAGNEPGFEEATRALFAGNREYFDKNVRKWPPDIRNHAKKLAAAAIP
jgi:hypothetical protein